MHRIQRRRGARAAIAAVALMSGLAASCAPSSPTTVRSDVCAPAGTPLSRIDIDIVSAPPGSRLDLEIPWFHIGETGGGPNWGIVNRSVPSLAPGQTRTVAAPFPTSDQTNLPDPGKCVHITAGGGLVYRVTTWADPNPLVVLAWTTGYLPLPNTNSWGYAPGVPVEFPLPPSSAVPVAVTGISNGVAVAAGSAHACALRTGGEVRCWGRGDLLQLANGMNRLINPAPTWIAAVTDAVAVDADAETTCAIVADGAVTCWGPGFAQLSGGPATVGGVSGAIALAVGDGHACALVTGGTVSCWGGNAHGELGQGTSGGASGPALAVPGLTGVTAISAGGHHTCAIASGGAVSCWGDNPDGALGNGTMNDSSTPITVAGLAPAAAVSTVANHTCVLVAGGAASCWGSNVSGELGNAAAGDRALAPVPVTGLTDATAIASGSRHTCATTIGGGVSCWGSVALGNGSSGRSDIPVAVSGLAAASQVTSGSGFSCAVVASGGVWCWGENFYGALGNGS